MSDQGFERLFTVEEANGLLADLRGTLAQIRDARRVVLAGGRRIRDAAAANGGGAEGRDYWVALARLRAGLERVAGQGILLRDPETGLVDFPSEREGRIVFLCWDLSEPEVGFWHGLESGYATRRPL